MVCKRGSFRTDECVQLWMVGESILLGCIGKLDCGDISGAVHQQLQPPVNSTGLIFFFYIALAFSWYVGWNVASIRSHGLSIDKAAIYALLDNLMENLLKEGALLPFSHPGFAECRVIRDGVTQCESTEPAIGNIESNFLYQPLLRLDAIQVSAQEHFEHTDRVDRWAACFWLIWCQIIIDKVEGYHSVDFPQRVVFWNHWLYIYENHCHLSALAPQHAISFP